MKRILLTGMSGTGKSTVIAALAARGFKAIDTDLPEWSEYQPASDGDGVVGDFDLVWREDRISELLASDEGDVLFLSGCAPNQAKFYARFDQVVLLSAPADVMAARLTERTNNPYGQGSGELRRSLRLKETVEPLLRRVAHVEIDTSASVDEVVERILKLL